MQKQFALKYAMKHFSQSDEDGITLEICRRLGLGGESTFFEIGVGNGLENIARSTHNGMERNMDRSRIFSNKYGEGKEAIIRKAMGRQR